MSATTVSLSFFFLCSAHHRDLHFSLHDALPISSSPRGATSARPERSACARISRAARSEEHTSELQSHSDLVCRLLLEKKKQALVANDRPQRREGSRSPNSEKAAQRHDHCSITRR